MKGRAGSLGRRTFVLAGAAALMAPPALAHRAQTVLTTITWNGATKRLDIAHRMHADDAEICLAKKTGVASVDITQVRNQAQLLLYIEEVFALADGAAKIVLEPVGAEFDGQSILLYQEAQLPAPPGELAIDDRILRDVFEGQTNLVNVRLATRTRTLIFAGSDRFKRAEGLL